MSTTQQLLPKTISQSSNNVCLRCQWRATEHRRQFRTLGPGLQRDTAITEHEGPEDKVGDSQRLAPSQAEKRSTLETEPRTSQDSSSLVLPTILPPRDGDTTKHTGGEHSRGALTTRHADLTKDPNKRQSLPFRKCQTAWHFRKQHIGFSLRARERLAHEQDVLEPKIWKAATWISGSQIRRDMVFVEKCMLDWERKSPVARKIRALFEEKASSITKKDPTDEISEQGWWVDAYLAEMVKKHLAVRAGMLSQQQDGNAQDMNASQNAPKIEVDDLHEGRQHYVPFGHALSVADSSPLYAQGNTTALSPSPQNEYSHPAKGQIRRFHAFPSRRQQLAPTLQQGQIPPLGALESSPTTHIGIRAELRRWQGLHGNDEPAPEVIMPDDPEMHDGGLPNPTRFGDQASGRQFQDSAADEQERSTFHDNRHRELDFNEPDPYFLNPGDLVDLDIGQKSVLAVFARRVGAVHQYYTMTGRWVNSSQKSAQFSISNWAPLSLVEPLFAYLPTAEQVMDPESLRRAAEVHDLGVPRAVAAPLVRRMVEFHDESLALFRKYASELDNAHNTLAHNTDLRYGSLVTIATALLGIPRAQLPLTALYVVRKSLTNAGFAFSFDPKSHRITGHLQIRSKEQVLMITEVVDWVRKWQDETTQLAMMSNPQKKHHRFSPGPDIIESFLKKARNVVSDHRQYRDPTLYGCVSPSKVRREITTKQNAIEVHMEEIFSQDEQKIVSFLEGWSLSDLFRGLPKLWSLPPLLLQATGLYQGHILEQKTAFLFLQELGTIMPYENRVRYDPHLLLPSSQHSRPLEQLMTSVITMSNKPDFSDSMSEIRRDWGTMPVYCIDDQGAVEVDDGISVEHAGGQGADEEGWWVHVHIANPTAFFKRDSPLARIARHMGESLYMPERAYAMMPRWATASHFSLRDDRPCLTFSALLNEKGEVVRNNVQSGFVRNVKRVTPQEVNILLGAEDVRTTEEFTVVVGGKVPHAGKANLLNNRKLGFMKDTDIANLKTLRMLSERRYAARSAQGGVSFDNHKAQVSVFQSMKPGLSWDHPYRAGKRRVDGDPVVQLLTRPHIPWFAPGQHVGKSLVQECMLLACEIGSSWAAARKIPLINRGCIPKKDTQPPEEFWEEVCVPAIAKNDGVLPDHIGLQYLTHMGSVVLTTTPRKHDMLGLDHYTKVTSPLRRYADMMSHWQLEAALLHEAETGRSLVTDDPNADRSFLPYSKAALNSVLPGLMPRERLIRANSITSENWWISMLMFRAHHYGEAKLSEVYHVICTNEHKLDTVPSLVLIQELNIIARMLPPRESGIAKYPQQGDIWEATIDRVEVFQRTTYLKPIRLVKRYD